MCVRIHSLIDDKIAQKKAANELRSTRRHKEKTRTKILLLCERRKNSKNEKGQKKQKTKTKTERTKKIREEEEDEERRKTRRDKEKKI